MIASKPTTGQQVVNRGFLRSRFLSAHVLTATLVLGMRGGHNSYATRCCGDKQQRVVADI